MPRTRAGSQTGETEPVFLCSSRPGRSVRDINQRVEMLALFQSSA
eukprot:COSAG06_NODE_54924_length_292_cov_0.792746_1_plen_44_part_01